MRSRVHDGRLALSPRMLQILLSLDLHQEPAVSVLRCALLADRNHADRSHISSPRMQPNPLGQAPTTPQAPHGWRSGQPHAGLQQRLPCLQAPDSPHVRPSSRAVRAAGCGSPPRGRRALPAAPAEVGDAQITSAVSAPC